MRKVLPYNVKKAYLMMLLALGIAPTFTSCEKDDPQPYDPIAEQLKTLRADSTRLAGEVRAAILPAKTVELDITNYFNGLYGQGSYSLYNGQVKNLKDSANVFKYVVENAHIELGNPLPTNEQTMMSLYNKSKSYLSTIETMDRLLNR